MRVCQVTISNFVKTAALGNEKSIWEVSDFSSVEAIAVKL